MSYSICFKLSSSIICLGSPEPDDAQTWKQKLLNGTDSLNLHINRIFGVGGNFETKHH